MSRARSLGTSSTRIERPKARLFASLRVRGDSLDPDQLTRILRVFPTTAYAKGMKYRAGERTGELVGRTGVWLLSTEGIVASDHLNDHLTFLVGVLVPNSKDFSPLTHLHTLLEKQKDLKADIACFWHGRFGEKRPSVPRAFSEFLKLVPADLELDFDTDSDEADRQRA